MSMDLSQMPPDQLQQVRKALSDEIQLISSSYGNLKMAQSRFGHSMEALSTIKNPENENKEIFVPLTSSMYIPGQLSDIKSVLVDVGTGYYIEKDIPAAETFITARRDMLQENVDNISKTIVNKRRDLESVNMVLQMKMMQLQEEAKKQIGNQNKVIS